MEKSYDVRGRQSNIFRLARFDIAALFHMLFYRILIFVAPISAAMIAASLLYPNASVLLASRLLILLVWILFTPQLFSAFKAFSLVSSRGAAFGKFSDYFALTQKRREVDSVYRIFPYAGIAVWAIAFVVLTVLWFA